MTILTREQRIAWVAWHEFVHRGADYYRQVWGGKEWQTTLSKLRQNSALRHLAEAIQAERNAAYLNSGQDVRVTPEQAMEEALAELSAAIEQGNADALIARYGRFAPTTGRTRLQALLGKMADVIRRVLGRITKRQITQEELSDADAIGLLRNITALQGADNLADARASAGLAERQTLPAQAAEQAVQRQERMAPADAAAYSTAPQTELNFGNRSIAELEREYAALTDAAGHNLTDNGRLIDVDLMRELNDEYRADRSLAPQIHRAASALSKELYARALARPVQPGRDPVVMFMAGGGGVGKSSAKAHILGDDAADITFDGTLSNLAKARANIEAALASGRDVEINYVYRSPEKSAEGAIQRAIATGRPVPIDVLAEAHAQSGQVVKTLAREYNNNKRVHIRAIWNDGDSLQEARLIPTEEIPHVTQAQAYQSFRAAVEAAQAAGTLTRRAYEAFTGRTSRPENVDDGVQNAKPHGLDAGNALDNKKYSTSPQQEFEATAQQYGGEAAYKQAKAAGQTELDYRQWVQVRTPSFKAWFGDWQHDPKNASKVVNPRTGEPQVVYHGTNAQFDTFDTPLNMPRIFLTRSRAFAQKYGRDAMPLFVNARNTLNVDYAGRGAFDEIEVNGATLYDIEELADHAWENGYDGVLADNVVDSGTRDAKQSINDEVIVTDPAQIKSATGNGGAFNPADANIYHSTAPETGDQTPDARQQRTLRLASNRILNIARAIWDGAKNIGGEPIDFGMTPPVYQALGAEALPLKVLNPRKLFSLLRPKSEQGQRGDNTHELTPELLAQVPQALQEPSLVFDSEQPGALVAVTSLQDNKGNPVVAAIHLGRAAGFLRINKIASIYGKDHAARVFNRWQKEGKLRYVDTKNPSLLTSDGVQFSQEKSAKESGRTVLTDADVVKLQQQAAQTEAETKTGQALFSTVWHGTPYRGIENEGFDLGRIGTGEGAQAYGWGIYFAGDRDVSEEYRRRLSDSEEIVNFRFGDEPFIRTNDGWRSDEHGWQLEGAEEVAANAITDGTDLAALIAEAEEDEMDVIWDGHMEVDLDTAREAAQMIANGDIEADTRQGQLYSAEIPEDEELLDWDDAYSKQPPDVQEKIRRTLEAAPQRALEDYSVASGQELADKILGDDPTGSNIYNSLDDIYGSDREASLALNDNGIPGLRYLDGNSRRAGEGSHNYVIWDDALLTPEAAQIEAMYSIPPQLVSDPPTQEGLAKRIMQAFTDPTVRDLWFDRQGELDRILRADPDAKAVRNAFKMYNARVQHILEGVPQTMIQDLGKALAAHFQEAEKRIPNLQNMKANKKVRQQMFMDWLDGVGKYINAFVRGGVNAAPPCRTPVNAALSPSPLYQQETS